MDKLYWCESMSVAPHLLVRMCLVGVKTMSMILIIRCVIDTIISAKHNTVESENRHTEQTVISAANYEYKFDYYQVYLCCLFIAQRSRSTLTLQSLGLIIQSSSFICQPLRFIVQSFKFYYLVLKFYYSVLKLYNLFLKSFYSVLNLKYLVLAF